jgi:hypothetical protein
MTLYLGIAIVLFCLSLFISTESFIGNVGGMSTVAKGVYVDTNVNGTIDGLTSLNEKLEDLKKTIDAFAKPTFSATDPLSSINQVLNTKDSTLYTGNVVNEVTNIKREMDDLQGDLVFLNEALVKITNTKAIYPYNPEGSDPPPPNTKTRIYSTLPQTMDLPKRKTRVYSTLPETIDILMLRSTQISERLKQIPSA